MCHREPEDIPCRHIQLQHSQYFPPAFPGSSLPATTATANGNDSGYSTFGGNFELPNYFHLSCHPSLFIIVASPVLSSASLIRQALGSIPYPPPHTGLRPTVNLFALYCR
ncbi:hypothetical protein CBS147325_792 [Penicillium roqueforti]|nr:hypothetical protein CBS147325_792 [Penicillium roqueforti]KAI3182993.1 hypothetical protein DTO046C5_8 [Penicillium roqueforti]